jgi:hypothetical protein
VRLARVWGITVLRELREDAGGALAGGAVGVAPGEAVLEGVHLRADLAGDRGLGVAAADLGPRGALVVLLVVLVGVGAAERRRDGGGGGNSGCSCGGGGGRGGGLVVEPALLRLAARALRALRLLLLLRLHGWERVDGEDGRGGNLSEAEEEGRAEEYAPPAR